ncbi:uncharacterized protein LOC136028101 isoform X2 [Artemia franciscana]|uniref:uncharacterized protein LOC136028101 isoform X2 n=1 Tax=Artemia franciscana TaxID=6661 RepID=UPI0032DA7C86
MAEKNWGESRNREDGRNQSQIAHGAPKFGTRVPNRIFIGGLPSQTNEDELARLFSQWGHVRQVKIIVDRANISKGYGFVTYETDEEALLALNETTDFVYQDRKLNVAPAIKKQAVGYESVQSPSPATSPSVYYNQGSVPLYQNAVQVYGQQAVSSPSTPISAQVPPQPQCPVLQNPPQQHLQAITTPTQAEVNPAASAYYQQQIPAASQTCYPTQLVCSPTVFFPANQPLQVYPLPNSTVPTWPQTNQWRWTSPNYSPGYSTQVGSPGFGYYVVSMPLQVNSTDVSTHNRAQNDGVLLPGYESVQPLPVQPVSVPSSQCSVEAPQITAKTQDISQTTKTEQARPECGPQPGGNLLMTSSQPRTVVQPLTVNTQFETASSAACGVQTSSNQSQISSSQLEQRQKLQPLVFDDKGNPPQNSQVGYIMLYDENGRVYSFPNGQFATHIQNLSGRVQSISLPTTPYQQSSDNGNTTYTFGSDQRSHISSHISNGSGSYFVHKDQMQCYSMRQNHPLTPGYQYERRGYGYYRNRRYSRQRHYGRDDFNNGHFSGIRPRYYPVSFQFEQQGLEAVLTPPFMPGVPPPTVSLEEITKNISDIDIKA